MLGAVASVRVAKRLSGFKVCATTPKNKKQPTATCRKVCKRREHVTSNNVWELLANNVASFHTGLKKYIIN